MTRIPRLLRRLADWMDPPKKPEAREPRWARADSLRTIIERRTIMLRAGTPSADWSGVGIRLPPGAIIHWPAGAALAHLIGGRFVRTGPPAIWSVHALNGAIVRASSLPGSGGAYSASLESS